MLVYACVCNMYSHRSVNVPASCIPRTMFISLLGTGPVGWICFVKLTLSLMRHDPKMLTYVISKVLTAETTGSQPLLNGENEGCQLSAVLSFSYTTQPEHLGSECFSSLKNPSP